MQIRSEKHDKDLLNGGENIEYLVLQRIWDTKRTSFDKEEQTDGPDDEEYSDSC